MAIKKMIYATKFRELSYSALLDLLILKKVGLEEIVLLHVVPREEVSFVPFGGLMKEKALELKEKALLKFENWEKELLSQGIRVKKIVEIGDPLSKIILACEEESADFLVVGKKKITGPFTGELTTKIVANSAIPVLVYRKVIEVKSEEGTLYRDYSDPFRRILIATDFSPITERVIGVIMDLTPLIEKIFLIHILKEGELGEDENQASKSLEKIRSNLTILAEPFLSQGFEVEMFYCIGDPADEILEFAREKDITLIAVGKTGKGFIKKILLGSVSEKLIRTSEIPLLIVP